jgi:hypothetical protein
MSVDRMKTKPSKLTAYLSVAWIAILLHQIIFPVVMGLNRIPPWEYDGIEIVASDLSFYILRWGILLLAAVSAIVLVKYFQGEDSLLTTPIFLSMATLTGVIGVTRVFSTSLLVLLTGLLGMVHVAVYALRENTGSSLSEPLWALVAKSVVLVVPAIIVSVILGFLSTIVWAQSCPSVMDNSSFCAGVTSGSLIPLVFYFGTLLLFGVGVKFVLPELPNITSETE